MAKNLSNKKKAELAALAAEVRLSIENFDPLKSRLLLDTLESEKQKLGTEKDQQYADLSESFRREVDSKNKEISALQSQLEKSKKDLQKQKDNTLLSF